MRDNFRDFLVSITIVAIVLYALFVATDAARKDLTPVQNVECSPVDMPKAATERAWQWPLAEETAATDDTEAKQAIEDDRPRRRRHKHRRR